MSLLSRLRRLLGRAKAQPPDATSAQATEDTQPHSDAVVLDGPQDDRLLEQLLSAEQLTGTLPAQRRLLELLEGIGQSPDQNLDEGEILSCLASLVEAGQARLSIDLLRCFVARLPDRPGLQLRFAETLYEQKSFTEAIGLLEALVEEPQARLPANFLLGDFYSKEAEASRALRHYEAILAYDIDYPRARRRADELRAQLDRPTGATSPTILGAEDLGPSSRYRLQRELGHGGNGTVYLALDRALGRPVAIKTLHPQLRARPEARARLFCEARLAAAMHHPGIVTVYDLDEGLSLVVMEHCAGGTLADLLAYGPQPAGTVLRRLSQIAAVLDLVHRCGVVHRDLKPANLLSRSLPGTGIPALVLTDFGIAHAGQPSDRNAPLPAGSLLYMSPEQRRGAESDPRTDLYSLGVLLLELLLGQPPLTPPQALQGVSLLEVDEIWRVLRDALPRAWAPSLVNFARALVAPDPGQRPADAGSTSRDALALALALDDLEDRTAALVELERLAGPPPHSAILESWLSQKRATLLDTSVDLTSRLTGRPRPWQPMGS